MEYDIEYQMALRVLDILFHRTGPFFQVLHVDCVARVKCVQCLEYL